MATSLEVALRAYNTELEKWLEAGGDQRLKEFSPLNAWGRVVKEMAATERRRRALT